MPAPGPRSPTCALAISNPRPNRIAAVSSHRRTASKIAGSACSGPTRPHNLSAPTLFLTVRLISIFRLALSAERPPSARRPTGPSRAVPPDPSQRDATGLVSLSLPFARDSGSAPSARFLISFPATVDLWNHHLESGSTSESCGCQSPPTHLISTSRTTCTLVPLPRCASSKKPIHICSL